MITNVEVRKNQNENNISLLRRFTRRVQGSGVLPRMRSIRYSERKISEYTRKKRALKRIVSKKKIEEMIKMGKMPEKPRGRRR